MEMTLIETKSINDILVHGYYYAEEAWFTRAEIGQALEYADPQHAILLIHERHKERLDLFSRGSQFETPSGKQEGVVYNIRGAFEICRWSTQPKADLVMDALYEMAETVMRKGYFSLMSDEELVQFIMERQKQRPTTLDLLKPSEIKARMHKDIAEKRDERTEQLKDLWIRRFGRKEQIAMGPELRRICAGDKALYHKYIDKYHQDEQKELKGQIIMF